MRPSSHRYLPLVASVILAACGAEEVPPPADYAADDSTGQLAVTPIPEGPLGESIRRGEAIFLATSDSLADHVGNDLACGSCHLDGGTRPNAAPMHGVYGRFPQYRGREDRIFSIEDRINGCMLRSMNGTMLPLDDPRMRDMVSFLAHLSKDIPVGSSVPGQGWPRPQQLSGDTVAGADIWVKECAKCHGLDGEGTPLAPPTWGDRSYNIGAGMARIRTAAGFIMQNMPFDKPGTITEEQAVNVADYLVSRPRPDFPGKENDWPLGNAPPDAAYRTIANPSGDR
jgi:thiosulfate dehydrogenase